MKKGLLYIWQLPQHLLGLLLIKVTDAGRWKTGGIVWYWFDENRNRFTRFFSGVSLGRYILLPYGDMATIKHEHGHSKQSEYLGPLYLIVIGLPSATGNLLARVSEKVHRIYYRLPWERWADKLGGVDRGAAPAEAKR